MGKKDIISFRNQTLVVTEHAIEQFEKRWLDMNPEQPMRDRSISIHAIEKMLAKAEPERLLPMYQVLRIMNNRFREAEYWEHYGWRFVIVPDHGDGKCYLVTVERAFKSCRI